MLCVGPSPLLPPLIEFLKHRLHFFLSLGSKNPSSRPITDLVLGVQRVIVCTRDVWVIRSFKWLGFDFWVFNCSHKVVATTIKIKDKKKTPQKNQKTPFTIPLNLRACSTPALVCPRECTVFTFSPSARECFVSCFLFHLEYYREDTFPQNLRDLYSRACIRFME